MPESPQSRYSFLAKSMLQNRGKHLGRGRPRPRAFSPNGNPRGIDPGFERDLPSGAKPNYTPRGGPNGPTGSVPPSKPVSGMVHKMNPDLAAKAAAYWTKERKQNAKGLPLIKKEPTKQLM